MKLSGSSYPKEKFRILEDNVKPNLDVINAMLGGKGDLNVPLYIVRNYLDPVSCNEIKDRFYEIVNETSGGDRTNDVLVKVTQIGATQFNKTSTAYFNECNQTTHNVNSLMSGIESDHILEDFMLEKTLREYFLSNNKHFGPSYYKGRYCNLFTARLWKNVQDKRLSLNAHEDLAQLEYARRDQFEIGNVKTVIASNLCVDNDENTTLLVWNICPDHDSKKNLNIEYTGYPYPLSVLEGFDFLSLKTQPGDLYFINANYIHAVQRTNIDCRISLGRFMGYSGPQRIVYWT